MCSFSIRSLCNPFLAVVAAVGLVGCETDGVTAVVETVAPASPNTDLIKTANGEVDKPKLVEESSAPKPDPKKIIDKSFDDIVFDIEPDAPFERPMLTPEIEALAGQRIRIRGYILPTAQKRGIKQFVLVRDNMECCFGPGAALYDCILISMVPGNTAEFSIRPVAVEGTFRIEEFKGFDGKHLAVFQLEGEKVE